MDDNKFEKVVDTLSPSDEPIVPNDNEDSPLKTEIKDVAQEETNPSTIETTIIDVGTNQENPLLEDDNKKKKKRLRLKYRTKENDIHFLGPLSYRYIRLIAWVFMAIAQIGLVLNIAKAINPAVSEGSFSIMSSVLSYVATMPLALFLLANFGVILRNRRNFKYLFIFYGGIMVGMYLLGNIIVLHYVYGLIHALDPTTTFQDVALLSGTFLALMGPGGYVFNIFVDMFLCVLTVFFYFYKPKKYFQGKKIIIFRLFVLIPLLYEVGSLIIKHAAMMGNIAIPSYFFFLLTSKPPLTFAAFFLIVLIMKIREVRFLKKYDNNIDLLNEHYSTNAHSLRTSITIAIVFGVMATIDVLVFFGYAIVQAVNITSQYGQEFDVAIFSAMQMGQNIGLGGSTPLLLVIPFVLLYSYTRTHKNKKLDSFVPFIGIGLVLFTVLEGSYIALRLAIPNLKEAIEGLVGSAEEEGGSSLEAIKSFINVFIPRL